MTYSLSLLFAVTVRQHRLFLLLTVLFCSSFVCAQDATTPLLTGSWQATYSNPALYGNLPGRLVIGGPGVVNDLYSENLTYNDVVGMRSSDQRILNLVGLAGLLDERNELRDDLTVETLGLGLRGDRLSFGLYHRMRAYGELDYPRNLIQVVAEGNAQFIGQTIEIAPRPVVTNYHEVGFGASYRITDRLHLGARVKYLGGIADFRTDPNASLGLTTGEENFALTLEQQLVLNTSGVIEYDGLDATSFDFSFGQLRSERLFSGNSGVAFDVGVFVDLDNVRLQAAANDLGASINWEEDVTTLTFSGSSAFSGLDVLEQLFEDTISFSGALDSLLTTFEPTESAAPYSTSLPASYLLGAEYDLTERLTAGVLLTYFDRPRTPETAVAVSARYRLIDELTVGVNYNARRNVAANLGLQLFSDFGPFQFLAATDNVLTVFRLKDSNKSGFRLGATLVLGRIRERKGE